MGLPRPVLIAAVVIGVAIGIAGPLSLRDGDDRSPFGATPAKRLPQTPRAWLDAYIAARPDDPARVCRDLFSARLRERLARETGVDCVRWHSDRPSPGELRLERVERAGDDVAVLDIFRADTGGYTALVLVREAGGLRAFQFIARASAPNTPRRPLREPESPVGQPI